MAENSIFGRIVSASENFLEAKKNVLPLALEVNTEPLNQPSLNFHELMGFDKVGSKDFHDHSVAYFIK